jgi:hypothetical protein
MLLRATRNKPKSRKSRFIAKTGDGKEFQASLGMTVFFWRRASSCCSLREKQKTESTANPSASLGMKTSGGRTFSLQRVGIIERVALGGDETRVGDDAAQLAFVGAVADAGGVDDIFFDQDAAHVVGAEL